MIILGHCRIEKRKYFLKFLQILPKIYENIQISQKFFQNRQNFIKLNWKNLAGISNATVSDKINAHSVTSLQQGEKRSWSRDEPSYVSK